MSEYIEKRKKELEEELETIKKCEKDEDYFYKRSSDTIAFRDNQQMLMKEKGFATNCSWGMYGAEDSFRFKSMTLPVFSTPTGASFDSLVDGSLLLSYKTVNDPNKVYSRIDNTTTDHVAKKIACMEGRTIPDICQGVMTSSGMSAIFMATMMFLEAGDDFVSSNRIYGGTNQLFGITYKKMGWKCNWVTKPEDYQCWVDAITPKTKFLFVETPSNPFLFVADVKKLAHLAHSHGIPLICDSTVASPALFRAFEYGADVIVHSCSKIMCSSGRAISGCVVAKNKIVCHKNPEISHNFGMMLQGGHFRNIGCCLHPPSAAALWDNLNSLEARLKQVSKSSLKIARFLEAHPKIQAVKYPGLESHPQHELAKATLKFADGKNGYGFLMSFFIDGDLERTKKFANHFDFGYQVTDLGRDFTAWTHSASTTHGQMTPEERVLAEVPDNLIRLSVGLEDPNDIIAALSKALDMT